MGSLGAPRPGCAGAPSQFESGGEAVWVQQSSPGAGIAARCPPPPRRAAPRAATQLQAAAPPPSRAAASAAAAAPPAPAARSDSSRGGCQPGSPARLLPFPSFLLALSQPPLCIHSLLQFAKLPCLSRFKVPRGQGTPSL
nr:uncharacterized protein LOC104006854 [Pan troglodytes]